MSLTSPLKTAASTPRFDAIDTLRGVAMLWMTVFHFCFDLNNFGHIKQDFYNNPVWSWQRGVILSLFLFTAGFSQAVAVSQGQSWPRFWRRWAQIAVCAALVTAGSYLMFPKTFIYFGVLHGMLVMLIVVRLTAGLAGRWPAALWLLGGATLALGWLAGSVPLPGPTAELLNSKALNWIGWVTHKPYTEDYVPLIPWLGVMWLGAAAGAWALAGERRAGGAGRPNSNSNSHSNSKPDLTSPSAPQPRLKALLLTPSNPATPWPVQMTTRLGRWSLPYYMVHQPVLIGGLSAWGWLISR